MLHGIRTSPWDGTKNQIHETHRGNQRPLQDIQPGPVTVVVQGDFNTRNKRFSDNWLTFHTYF